MFSAAIGTCRIAQVLTRTRRDVAEHEPECVVTIVYQELIQSLHETTSVFASTSSTCQDKPRALYNACG